MRSKKFVFVISFVFLFGLGAGFAHASDGRIVEGMGAEPTTLNIDKATRRPESTVINLISEPLLIFNNDLQLEPLLAKSWSVSEDNLTWTINLKEGIHFHNGQLLDAEAVKFSLNRHKDGSHGWMLGPLKEIIAEDTYTVKIKMKEPYPMLPNYLANYWLGIISPKKVKEFGGDYGVKAVSGTGPFMFEKWVSGDRLVLKRNDEYDHGPSFLSNQGPAKVEEWAFKFIPERSTLIAEIQKGDVDLSDYIRGEAVSQLKNYSGTSITSKKAPSTVHLAINLGYKEKGGEPQNDPFSNVKVREATAHAVNKEAVIKAAMFGAGEPAYTLTPPNVKMYWEGAVELGKKYTNYDPEESRKLLKEAGWVDSDNDGIREKDGKELKAVLFAFTIVRYKRIATVVQPMLKDVGFKVEIKTMEAGDLYESVTRGEHDLLATAWMGWGFPQDGLDPMVSSEQLGTSTNWFLYSNPTVDELLKESKQAIKQEDRLKASKIAQQIIIEDVLAVPIAYPMNILGYKNSVKGVEEYMKHPWAFSRVDSLRSLLLHK